MSDSESMTSHEVDERVVTAQIGREPRKPWRVARRCSSGFPCVIASPARLDDGSPFPTLFWLTCPHLSEGAALVESHGATSRWARRAAAESEVARALYDADRAVRAARVDETSGDDPCTGTGIAGQRDPLLVKCIHAHTALALAGIADPIGDWLIGEVGLECGDARCHAHTGAVPK